MRQRRSSRNLIIPYLRSNERRKVRPKVKIIEKIHLLKPNFENNSESSEQSRNSFGTNENGVRTLKGPNPQDNTSRSPNYKSKNLILNHIINLILN